MTCHTCGSEYHLANACDGSGPRGGNAQRVAFTQVSGHAAQPCPSSSGQLAQGMATHISTSSWMISGAESNSTATGGTGSSPVLTGGAELYESVSQDGIVIGVGMGFGATGQPSGSDHSVQPSAYISQFSTSSKALIHALECLRAVPLPPPSGPGMKKEKDVGQREAVLIACV